MLRRQFFLGQELTATNLVFAGSSITSGPTGYSGLTTTYAVNRYPGRAFAVQNAALGGMSIWNNLYRAPTAILPYDADVFIFDNTNTGNDDHGRKALDAFVRRVWTERLHNRIVALLFPFLATYTDAAIETPSNAVALAAVRTICDYYDIPYVDFDAEVRDRVMNGGEHVSDYLIDVVHPTAAGHALVLEMLRPTLDGFLTSPPAYTALPTALYDTAGDYQQEPQLRNGTDYDGRSGTWTDNGTVIESSDGTATVTFSGTFASFGIEAPAGHINPTLAYTVDGVDYDTTFITANGVGIAAGRGAHTVTIKVRETVKIARFVAI